MGHGGLFKTEQAGQQLMAAALKVPVAVMESAGEGGAWGIALLASYRIRKGEVKALQRIWNIGCLQKPAVRPYHRIPMIWQGLMLIWKHIKRVWLFRLLQ